LAEAGVEVQCGAEARRVGPVSAGRGGGGGLEVLVATCSGEELVAAARVYNCTYSRINRLLADSALPRIPLKHELTELVLIDPPEELAQVGITVMCGPFFSCMPFPSRRLHSLSHVRYTPHLEWADAPDQPYRDADHVLRSVPLRSRYGFMVRDAARYVPVIARARYRDSLWEVKTVLPRSEVDDSRPILFRASDERPALYSVMGSKIDNVYDVFDYATDRAGAGAGR